jgi:hypothetical protein
VVAGGAGRGMVNGLRVGAAGGTVGFDGTSPSDFTITASNTWQDVTGAEVELAAGSYLLISTVTGWARVSAGAEGTIYCRFWNATDGTVVTYFGSDSVAAVVCAGSANADFFGSAFFAVPVTLTGTKTIRLQAARVDGPGGPGSTTWTTSMLRKARSASGTHGIGYITFGDGAGAGGATLTETRDVSGDYTITADATWEDPGYEITLGAGVYLLYAQITARAHASAEGKRIIMRVVTSAGAGVPGQSFQVATVVYSGAGVEHCGTASLFTRIDLASSTTIKIQVQRDAGTWTTSRVENSTVYGNSGLLAEKVS